MLHATEFVCRQLVSNPDTNGGEDLLMGGSFNIWCEKHPFPKLDSLVFIVVLDKIFFSHANVKGQMYFTNSSRFVWEFAVIALLNKMVTFHFLCRFSEGRKLSAHSPPLSSACLGGDVVSLSFRSAASLSEKYNSLSLSVWLSPSYFSDTALWLSL